MRAFDWHEMWAPQWPPQETALRAALVYLGVQVLLRLAGRKELGRYASFNVAILVLVTTAMRQTLVVEGDPIPLVRGGVVMRENLRRAHMSEAEIMSWARQRGVGTLGEIQDAFLEPSGRVSVIAREHTAVST